MASKKEQIRLFTLIKSGDAAAWDEFKKEYIPIVLRVIKTHKLKDLVEDYELEIIDKSLSQAFSYLQNADKFSNIDGLVALITSRMVNRYFEIGKKKKNMVVDGGVEDIPDGNPGPEEDLIDQENAFFLEEDKKYLNICTGRLTKTQAMVLNLWKQGKTWADIARIRKVAQPAISQIRDAAFKKLRDCINELRRVRQINSPVFHG